MMLENFDMGKNVTCVCKEQNCAVFSVKDSTGDGTMTMYQVYPGVMVLYNDFHMEHCLSGFRSQGIFCIDHCREGRIEWEFGSGNYLYIEAGDMQISNRDHHTKVFSFPLSHYHGITIGFMLEEAAEPLSEILEGMTFDLPAMKQKFCPAERPFIMRAAANIEHIFLEMYALPDQIRIPYLKIKVLELLLFLRMLEKPEGDGERPYFYKTQVDKVKAIRALLTENLDSHYTLEELSEQFSFPLTAMKLCFKGVYGSSIYAYMKAYRMNAAALMLRQSDDNVTAIASRVGYDNASKFAAAFRSVKGMTPAAYRKSIV